MRYRGAMKRLWYVAGGISLLVLGTVFLATTAGSHPAAQRFGPHPRRLPKGVLFAHDLGAIDGHAYTNSLDAFDHDYELGARYF